MTKNRKIALAATVLCAIALSAFAVTQNPFKPGRAVWITGTYDAIQLRIRGFSTQTTNPISIQNSAGTEVFGVSNTGTFAAAGAYTPTGGIVATTNGRISDIPIGSVAYGSLGSNLVHVAGTEYFTELWLPANKTITGIGVLNGATVGTHKLIFALASSSGAIVATTALAGATSAGADAFQEIALTTPYAAVGPARYWVIVQCEGVTPKTRRIAASTFLNFAGSATGTFGTIAAITPATSTTADMGPIAYVY